MKLSRFVTVRECPWLKEDLPPGTEVYSYSGYTYGRISSGGVAVTFLDGKDPFFELPGEALE